MTKDRRQSAFPAADAEIRRATFALPPLLVGWGDWGYSHRVPYLIDGNNLIHALAEVGPEVSRTGLCGVLAAALAGETVCVVFDGPQRMELSPQVAEAVEAVYCPGRKADDTVIARMNADSAPRRLIVVSSDREIRRHARRRRCESVTSEQFARTLVGILGRQDRPRRASEPPEKHHGLAADQTDDWMELFGYPPSDD